MVNTLFAIYRRNAETKGYSFQLSKEQMRGLVFAKCHYCGDAPSRELSKASGLYNGVDRKDNSKGYTANNSVACCWSCNLMKRDLPYDCFIDKVTRIAQIHS